MRVISSVFAWFVMVAVAAAGNVKNDGFESGQFPPWQTAGEGWRISKQKNETHKGGNAAINDVTGAAGDEFRVIYQEVKATGGKKYRAEVWIKAVAVRSSESFLEVQFVDDKGTMLEQFQSDFVERDQPYTLAAIDEMEAPEGTKTASVRGVVHLQKDGNSIDFGGYHMFDDFDFKPAKEQPGKK